MKLFEQKTDSSDSQSKLSLFTKVWKWGGFLAAIETIAVLEGTRLDGANSDFSVPSKIGGFIIAILLLIFLSSKQGKKRTFTTKQVIGSLVLSVILIIGNHIAVSYLTISYPPQSRYNGAPAEFVHSRQYVYLIGIYKTDAARHYQEQTQPPPSDAEILFDFTTANFDKIWTDDSLLWSKVLLYCIYFITLASISVTIIAALNRSKLEASDLPEAPEKK